MDPVPARIHILLARDAPVGVVIRRGPSKRVCTMLWDRETDEFTLGQWLRGRVYERRSDISPDGKLMIYFAMNGKWESESLGSWTAVSRAPYLKAIDFRPRGDCWLGGGLFTGNETYWLNDAKAQKIIPGLRNLDGDEAVYYGYECRSVYYPRLQRDGWSYKERVSSGAECEVDILEKDLPGGWVLRKLAHAQTGPPLGKGCYWDEHELVHAELGMRSAFSDWEWAEWDRNRLVWATRGQVWAGGLTESGLEDERMLADLNDMTFEPIAAPY